MTSSWSAPIDSYCERLDASFWSEPVNALSNGAFILAAGAAFVLWRRTGAKDGPVMWLIVVTAAIGFGSFLFHTFANRWSVLADVVPIAVFIYSYFFFAMRRYLAIGIAGAVALTIAFFAFNAGFGRIWWAILPGVTLNGSVSYLPAALAMIVVGLLCSARARAVRSDALSRVGRSLLAAAAAFTLSLVFRTLDREICPAVPLGSHFLWHALNGIVLFVLMRAAIVFGTGHQGNLDSDARPRASDRAREWARFPDRSDAHLP